MTMQGTIERKPASEGHSKTARGERTFAPAVDIVETADHLTIVADMPGIAPSDVEIQVEQGMLTIHGRANPQTATNAKSLLCECEVGDFHRTFQVGEMIDYARSAAELADGVLRLRLPKVAAARPRRIEVKSAS